MPNVDFRLIDHLAREGDEEALVAAGYGLVRYVIGWKGYFIKRFGSRMDLLQEGMIGFLEARRDWDGRGSFANWGVLCVHRQLIETIKKATRKKHLILSEANTLDAPAHWGQHEDRVNAWRLRDLNGLGDDPADLVVDRSEGGSLIEALCEGMSEDLERPVFLLCVIGGRSYHEAAAILGKHDKSVDNALQRIRRKLLVRAAALASDERISAGARVICARVAAADGPRPRVRRRIAS